MSEKVALEICSRLPRNDDETNGLIQSGYESAKHMSWESVAENYILKSLNKAIQKKHDRRVQLRA